MLLAAAAALAPTASAAEEVRVRFGRHDDFVRVVFDWTAPTPYKIALEPSGVLLTFDAPNGFDLSRLENRPGLTATSVSQGVARIAYETVKSVKHWRLGDRVVIDFYQNDKGEPVPAATASKPAPEMPTAAKANAPPESQAASNPEPAIAPETTPPMREAKAEAAGLQPGQKNAAGDAPAAAPETASNSTADAATEIPQARTIDEGTAPVALATRTEGGATKHASPPPVVGPPDLAQIPPEELAAAIPPKAEIEPATRLPLRVERHGDTIVLGLAALENHAAAFTRAGAHWIVLDTPLPVDLDVALSAGLDIVQLPFPDKTVLHIRVEARPTLSAWRGRKMWRFAIGGEPPKRAATVPVARRQAAPEGARLVVDDVVGAQLLRINDPEVGDALFVVAVADDRRIDEMQDTPDVSLPATALGVVIEPKTEGVGVRLSDDRLEVRKRGGLRMSDPDRVLLAAADTRASEIDPERWRGDHASYIKGLKAGLAKMNGVASFRRNAARMELARFALARGFATEALGFLQAIARSDQGAAEGLQFRAMRGIARAMLDQHDLAAEDLADPALVGDPHVEIWRALGMAQARDSRFASAKFRRFWSAVSAWPERHRVRLMVAAGEASLDAGQPDVAERFIQSDITPGRSLAPEQLAALAVVDGGVKHARGDVEGAKAAYELAGEEGDPLTRSKADLSLIKLLYDEGELDARAATDRLTRLQLGWRGDRVEYETLKALGEIQLANSRFREGFRALGEAAQVFGTRFDVTDVRAAITAGFEKAFVGDGGANMTAFEAVALFQDYEDYAPAGHNGDLALATLARRLASLDLIDEADEIMDHLVRRRLTGKLRADVGLELADLRLARRDWAGAMQTLDQHDLNDPEIPAEERQWLVQRRARAFAGLGRVDTALDLLASAEDRESVELRGRIAWDHADWVSARAAYRQLETFDAYGDGALDRETAAIVVRWAIAATMLNNPKETQELSDRFRDRVSDPALAKALAALAAPDVATGDALEAARAAIANVDTMAKAMRDYNAARQGEG